MFFKILKHTAILMACFLPMGVQADTNEQKIIAVQQAKIEALQRRISQIKEKVGAHVLELQLDQCGGKQYNCSVRSCIDLCLNKGGRVAHRHELVNLALKGGNHCAFTISYDSANNRFDSSYPMYDWQGGGCWSANKAPNMPLLPISPDSHQTTISANCACMVPTTL